MTVILKIEGWQKLNGRKVYICTAALIFDNAYSLNELYTVTLVSAATKKAILQIDVWVDVMELQIRAKDINISKSALVTMTLTRSDLSDPSHFIEKLSDTIGTNTILTSLLYLLSEIDAHPTNTVLGNMPSTSYPIS